MKRIIWPRFPFATFQSHYFCFGIEHVASRCKRSIQIYCQVIDIPVIKSSGLCVLNGYAIKSDYIIKFNNFAREHNNRVRHLIRIKASLDASLDIFIIQECRDLIILKIWQLTNNIDDYDPEQSLHHQNKKEFFQLRTGKYYKHQKKNQNLKFQLVWQYIHLHGRSKHQSISFLCLID